MCTCGVICDKAGFAFTVVDGSEVDSQKISLPPGLKGDDNRPAALAWLLEEAQRQLEMHGVTDLRILTAPSSGRYSASADRCEVEACLKIAAHRRGTAVACLSRDQVRVTFGLERGEGAFEALLDRPDVQERGSKARREQYLLATAPLG